MARKTAQDRKAEIVAATLALADRLGPDRLTTQAVADAVGLTQPAVFRHFPSKQVLWQAVAETIAARLEAAWAGALAGQAAPLDRVRALVLVQIAQIEADPAIPAILHSRELQCANAGLRQGFRGLMLRFQALLQAELEAARAAGATRADLEPADGAMLLIALVQGVAIRWSLGNRGFALAAEAARLLEVQIALFRGRPAAEAGR
jgi:AcrR family transcriptional regulator